MRVTPDMLVKLAKDHLARRMRQPNDIIAVYLTGSVLRPEPLLGGTTDIDMVIIHKENPAVAREVLRVSTEVSFDIEHHHQSFYTFPRRLRQNPWLGFALCDHNSFLYDPDHWLDFIQAGVSAQFDTPESFYARSSALAEKARQTWFELEANETDSLPAWMVGYLKAVGLAANAIAALSGEALTIRRLLLDFPARAEAVGQLPLAGALARLLGNENFSPEAYHLWRPAWEQALLSASQAPNCPPNLSRARKPYFLTACDSIAESGNAFATLWPILETWRQSAEVLADVPAQQESWLEFLASLGFTSLTTEKMTQSLDYFIEQVEALLETWKGEYGL